MRKTIIIIFTLLLFIGSIAWATSTYYADVPVKELKELGAALKEPVAMLKEDTPLYFQIRDAEQMSQLKFDKEFMDKKIAGVIEDKLILTSILEIRTIQHAYGGSDIPLQDAWDSLKLEAAERKFAEEHGLLPSQDEIDAFTTEIKGIVESEPKNKRYVETLLDAMGISWEYYWEVYKPTYEIPIQLIKINIGTYCEGNDI